MAQARIRAVLSVPLVVAALLLLDLVSLEPAEPAFPCELWQRLPADEKRATAFEQLAAPASGAARECVERHLGRFVAVTDAFCREHARSAFADARYHALALEAERRQSCPLPTAPRG